MALSQGRLSLRRGAWTRSIRIGVVNPIQSLARPSVRTRDCGFDRVEQIVRSHQTASGAAAILPGDCDGTDAGGARPLLRD